MSTPQVLLIPGTHELKYVSTFRMAVGEVANVLLIEQPFLSFGHVVMYCRSKGIKHIATTNLSIVRLFTAGIEGNQGDNIGCRYTRDGISITVVPPLGQLRSTNSGIFLAKHYVRKLVDDGTEFLRTDSFTYKFVTSANLPTVKLKLNAAKLVAVDIETIQEPMRMTSVAYTLMTHSGMIETYVVQHTAENFPFCMIATRQLNATKAAKITQNGMYDNLYFTTFNCPLHNWRYDTYHMMHCLFPELPKTLHFIAGFFLHNYVYWKDESKTDLYGYNGKDTHKTLWSWLGLMKYIEENKAHYALTNYREEFSNVFPAISCDLEGVMIDEQERLRVRAIAVQEKENSQAALDTLLGQPLNSNSPKQVASLLRLFHPKLKGTDETELTKMKESHPVAARIIDHILNIRGQVKAIGTYFDMKLWHQKLFYHLDPGGTETGRFASKSSSYWCGTQIQNIPAYARSMVVFEHGWIGGAVDKAQSEAYCTAYLAQDRGLKHAVNTSPDFHSHNASMFFGIPFDQIFDAKLMKKLNPALRNLAKRVNHGANYNMGPSVLLDTMGAKAVREAQRLLGLPPNMHLLGVCAYLLEQFDRTYPRVRGEWQREVVKEVTFTGKLTLPTGYVRRTFLQPAKNKRDLNAAVASLPQGLSVWAVNKAMRKIFWDIQHAALLGKFRLKMQVHDEVVFIARPDVFEDAITTVMDLMIVPITIHNDTMKIPSSRAQGHRWSELKD